MGRVPGLVGLRGCVCAGGDVVFAEGEQRGTAWEGTLRCSVWGGVTARLWGVSGALRSCMNWRTCKLWGGYGYGVLTVPPGVVLSGL